MKYAVDRIEEEIYVLENIKTGEIIEVKKDEVPEEAHEGSILKVVNDEYILDEKEEKKRRTSLRERMEKLKKKSEQ